jgi:hypothetical protein
LLIAAALVVPTGPAHAGATVLRFEFTTPITEFVASDDCRPDISAIVTGTEVLAGQRVEPAPAVEWLQTPRLDHRHLTVQFPDGSYCVGESSERFAAPFVINGPSQERASSVATFARVDSVTVYDADGSTSNDLVEVAAARPRASVHGPECAREKSAHDRAELAVVRRAAVVVGVMLATGVAASCLASKHKPAHVRPAASTGAPSSASRPGWLPRGFVVLGQRGMAAPHVSGLSLRRIAASQKILTAQRGRQALATID